MRALLTAAAAVHVALLVGLFLAVALGGELRVCLALAGAGLVTGLWVLWIHGQIRDAELAVPPAGARVPAPIGADF